MEGEVVLMFALAENMLALGPFIWACEEWGGWCVALHLSVETQNGQPACFLNKKDLLELKYAGCGSSALFATSKFSSAKGHTDFSVLKKIELILVSYERKLSPREACRWWS